jgi:hypothetical protein
MAEEFTRSGLAAGLVGDVPDLGVVVVVPWGRGALRWLLGGVGLGWWWVFAGVFVVYGEVWWVFGAGWAWCGC